MTCPIAIIGMACHYPDARNPCELWESVLAQRQAFRRIPDERLRLDDYYAPRDRNQPDATYAVEAAVIEGYQFDRTRFRVVGSTYRSADLAHWLALDVADAALSDAGFAEGVGLPRESTGVLVGNSLTGEFSRANVMRLRWPYVRKALAGALAEHGRSGCQIAEVLDEAERIYKAPFPEVGDETLAGGLSNTIAGRICNHFDLKGGGYTVDAACASSLLAVANACSALVAGDLDVAVAGGVDLSLDPFELVGFARVGALAEGDMRVYDKHPTGFLPGEGCAMVVLMRYDQARLAGREIHGLIRGWGVSSDGAGGITRPEVDGQRIALERAYRRAGFGIETVGYFEGHGTGTAVGDAAELKALCDARRTAGAQRAAALGSIKANIGHTKAAAGIAGLIKATLAIQRQVIPPATACQTPHPTLDESPPMLRAPSTGEAWPTDQPMRAAVSAMGFGGVNAHVVLESASTRRRSELSLREQSMLGSAQDAELFVLAGADRSALSELCARVCSIAASLSRSELADLAVCLASRHARGSRRAAVVARRPNELAQRAEQLGAWISDGVERRIDSSAGVMLGAENAPPRVGLLFPGQGSPVQLDGGAWSRRFEEAKRLCRLSSLPRDADPTATQVAQPAIVLASLAGLQLFDRMGVDAALAVGHSLGEMTAYHWSGAMSEQSLLDLAFARGAAMANLPGDHGAMAAISAPAGKTELLLNGSGLVVSGYNSPTQTIVSGESRAIEGLVQRAAASGLHASQLRVSHAFHSQLMASASPDLELAFGQTHFDSLNSPVYSTITGDRLSSDQGLAQLLIKQLTSPVRFIDAVRAADSHVDLWIEIGPGAVLGALVEEFVDTPVLSCDAGGRSLLPLLTTLGAAFASGVPMRMEALYEDRFVRPFALDWQPRFFVNPCQVDEVATSKGESVTPERTNVNSAATASAPQEPELVAETANAAAERNGEAIDDQRRDVHRLVKEFIARRAEIPVDAVRGEDRLLSDLHFSSITVGQITAEATEVLGLPSPAMPTAAANATVSELAEALEELLTTRGATSGENEALDEGSDLLIGVNDWTRAFTVELVERPLPNQRIGTENSGNLQSAWSILSPADHPLLDRLHPAIQRLPGAGVLLCLMPGRQDESIQLLLDAGKAVLDRPNAVRLALLECDGCGAPFARSLHLELPHIDITVVEAAHDDPRVVDWLVDECRRGGKGYVESHFDQSGVRRQPVLRLLPFEDRGVLLPLEPDDVLLVTGGGKGIGAECALQLARASGAKLALVGRSKLQSDPALAANLERIRAAGLRAEYFSADVGDSDAVRDAVVATRRELGEVTAVLHAAGTNHPQSLATLDFASFQRTMRPKVEGLHNVLGAVQPEHVRLLVAFGSIIARTGMRGNGDYAVANAWLARIVDEWKQRFPHCDCLTMESSVWAGVGMGERLGRVDALRRDGISAIPLEQGVQALQRLLAQTRPRTEIVVAGRIGEPPTLATRESDLPLLRFLERPRSFVPGVELIADAELSTDSDPYLLDHVYQGTPLFPAVMGLEAMAQTALAAVGAENLPVLERVRFDRPVAVPHGQQRILRTAALVRDDGSVDVVIRCSETQFSIDHFRCVCRFDDVPTSPRPRVATNAPSRGGADPVMLDAHTDLYGKTLFQSGRFQKVQGYKELHATHCVAMLSATESPEWFRRYLPNRLVLGDPARRDAAIHAIQACIPHGTLLPVSIEQLHLGCFEGPATVRADERDCSGDDFTYDIELRDSTGVVREIWEGLQLRRMSSAAPAKIWPAALVNTYLQRRVAELSGELSIRVELSVDLHNANESRSNRNRYAVVAGDRQLQFRPDGQPEINGVDSVSAAHAGPFTLVAAADAPVACDLELIKTSANDAPPLGPRRNGVAKLVQRESGDDLRIAEVRVWTAAECLIKYGAALDAPLILDAILDDHWVLFRSGSTAIFSWTTAVRECSERLAVAILVEDGRPGV